MSNVRNKSEYWNETWHLALQALRANKLRAALTMLGVIIGSGCIVLVVTVALAGKRYIITQIEGVGSNLVYAGITRSNNSSRLTLSDEISLGDMEAMKTQIPEVAVVAGASDIPMTVVAAGVERPVKLVGVTDGFQQIRRLVVFRGRYFDPDDMMTHAKVCLLTQELAERVFPHQDPVGQEIRVGDLRFAVIGVFRERISTFGETEIARESVLIPFGLMTYYTGSEYIRTLYVQADSPEAVPGVTKQVAEVLKSRHRPGAEYDVENLASLLDSARKISEALTVLLVVIALIALTISGIGVMNIMLVSCHRAHARDRHTQSRWSASRRTTKDGRHSRWSPVSLSSELDFFRSLLARRIQTNSRCARPSRSLFRTAAKSPSPGCNTRSRLTLPG